jgi:hypothetical protein
MAETTLASAIVRVTPIKVASNAMHVKIAELYIHNRAPSE